MTSSQTVHMSSEMAIKLKKSLILHEGYRKFPYVDTKGKTTIGIGYNLTDRGVQDDWINTQYNSDVGYFYHQLSQFPWYKDLNADRQIALIDMCFMGWKRFLGFHKMIEYLSIHNYPMASEELLNSDWAQEVKGRAYTLANVLRTGVYDL